LQEKEELESLFDQQIELRPLARNAGFENYRDYAFRNSAGSITPAHCEAFHAAVESDVMPLQRQLQARRRETMKLRRSARGFVVDPQNRPLRPFEQTANWSRQ
jgi:oligoendopeptidase F